MISTGTSTANTANTAVVSLGCLNKDVRMTMVPAGDLPELARAALLGQGFPADLTDEVVTEFVTAELLGQRSHGLGKLASLRFDGFDAVAEFVERGSVLTVNGAGGSGLLVLRAVATRLTERAGRQGVALASVRNFSRHGALYPYTEIVARGGFVGILMNSAGPAAVTPYGSIDPVTGTNPLCFSFPTPAGPHTLDFSTAEIVWGEIRQATLECRELPTGPFLDAWGEVTTTPSDVNAVKAFGGAKGWALNLAIELLAGVLVGASSGLAVQDEFDCGALMIAIDPNATSAGAAFPESVRGLLEEVRQARPAPGQARVRVPGDRRLQLPAPTEVDIPPATMALLQRLATGEKVSELSSNPLLN
jgi:L-2-hydroxycarboxylate dehydrogenase (NAD+)